MIQYGSLGLRFWKWVGLKINFMGILCRDLISVVSVSGGIGEVIKEADSTMLEGGGDSDGSEIH